MTGFLSWEDFVLMSFFCNSEILSSLVFFLGRGLVAVGWAGVGVLLITVPGPLLNRLFKAFFFWGVSADFVGCVCCVNWGWGCCGCSFFSNGSSVTIVFVVVVLCSVFLFVCFVFCGFI